jgi:hypothetical protein
MPISQRKASKVLLAILTVFVLLATAYSVQVPIFEASDEYLHYPFVEHLSRTWSLPVQPLEPGAAGPWRQEGSQPPLYYLLAAGLTAWIDTSDVEEVRQLNPQAVTGAYREDRQNVNLVVHDPARESFPWKGTVLAVHLARFLSVLLGAWSVYLGWRLARELFPEPSWLADATAAVHAFTPMFIFITASVNNDALVIPLAILALLLMVRILKSDVPRPRVALILGAVMGMAVLTKEGALGLLPLALATSLWSSWHVEGRPRTLTRRWIRRFTFDVGSWALPLLLIGGWWYWRNYRLYGDILGLNAFLAAAGERPYPPSVRQLWSERSSFMAAYWGNFGGLNVLMPSLVYHLLNGIALVAGLGLVVRLVRWLRDEHSLWPFHWQTRTAARALAWAWPAALLVSVVRWTRMTMASQGRLVFPGLPIWSLGLLLGLLAWIPQKHPQLRRGVLLVPALLLLLSSIALPLWITPAYALPPSLPADATIPHPLDVNFGDHLRLLGYEIEPREVRPGERVELSLYWESMGPTPTDHKVFVHLTGEGDRIVAQEDGFPGRGLLSTRRLVPGRTWRDRYLIEVPRVAYAPDTLTVSVGVYDAATGVRLPRVGADAHSVDQVRFGQLVLAPIPSPLPNPAEVRFGDGLVLRGYDLDELALSTGAPLTVTLYWEATADLQQDYTASVQVINARWEKAAQLDAQLVADQAPTSRWEPGHLHEEHRVLELAPDAPPGHYDLRVAVYRATEGGVQLLPVTWQEHQVPQDHVTLTSIVVEE